MSEPKTNIVVLFGGQSAEHDVSCTSVVAVIKALDPNRYNVRAVGVTRDGRWVDSPTANQLVTAVRTGSALPERIVAEGESLTPMAALGGGRGPMSLESASSPSALGEGADSPTGHGVAAPGPQSGELVVFPVLHGPKGEDGTVQGMLELANVPYVGSGVLGSALAMDKAAAKRMFDAVGIPQALWLSRRSWELESANQRSAFVDAVSAGLGWPVFVKPANMGSSVGVSRAKDPEEFLAALDVALNFDDTIVVEESVVGREIEFAVLGNEHPEVSVAGEILPGKDFYDYEDKYLDDSAKLMIPAPLDAAQLASGQQIAARAFAALNCEGMARVDFFLDEQGRWLVNEVNTIPGFTPISMYPKMWAASGLPYEQLVDRLVQLAISRNHRRARFTGRPRMP
jgi:D-alanine-D-alanine ligase